MRAIFCIWDCLGRTLAGIQRFLGDFFLGFLTFRDDHTDWNVAAVRNISFQIGTTVHLILKKTLHSTPFCRTKEIIIKIFLSWEVNPISFYIIIYWNSMKVHHELCPCPTPTPHFPSPGWCRFRTSSKTSSRTNLIVYAWKHPHSDFTWINTS